MWIDAFGVKFALWPEADGSLCEAAGYAVGGIGSSRAGLTPSLRPFSDLAMIPAVTANTLPIMAGW